MKPRVLTAAVLLCAVIGLLGYAVSRGGEGGVRPVFDVPRPAGAEENPMLPPAAAFPATPVIDPGHGGFDGGAVSLTGAQESVINLDISLRMDLIFRFLGLRPVMTRETDISLNDPQDRSTSKKTSDLKKRVAIVRGVQDAVLISIHQNKFPAGKYSGAQVFHNGQERNRAFAEAMQDQLRNCLNPGNVREAKRAEIYILKHVSCPAILIECGFLSNAGEEALLRDPAYQKKLALSICGGLMKGIAGETPV